MRKKKKKKPSRTNQAARGKEIHKGETSAAADSALEASSTDSSR